MQNSSNAVVTGIAPPHSGNEAEAGASNGVLPSPQIAAVPPSKESASALPAIAPIVVPEPQPVAERPIEHTAPGISSVADFLPPTSPESTEVDTVMTDAIAEPPKLDAPATETVPTTTEPIQQHTPAPDAVEEPIPTPLDTPAPINTDASQQSFASDAQDKNDSINDINSDAKISTPLSSFPPFDSSAAQAAEVKEESSQVDVKVPEPLNPSTTRAREEDDDAADEHSAKRTRLDESAIESPAETPVTEDFKRPDLPPPVQSATAPAVNGTATSHLPARSTYSSEPLNNLQRKLLEEKMKNTKKVKSALPFLRPVDIQALNIPNYPNVIKTPMDLGTMEAKLKAEQYVSLEDFVNDFDLMVNNCFTFNGPAHAVSGMAQNLRAYFLKQMDSVPTGDAATATPKPVKKESPAAKPQPRRESRASMSAGTPKAAPAPGDTFALLPGGTPQIRRDSNAGRPKRTVIPPASRDLPYSGSKPKRKENMAGLKFCEHVLDELRKPRYHQMNLYFLEPVDPVALNIPHYFKIIKHPMDMLTITNKLKNNQYSTAEEFKADFELIFDNCYKFNPSDNAVHITGKQFQSEFEALWKSKNEWIKKNQPRSQRVTPTSDNESESEESSEEEADDGDDEKEATIRALKEQLANMQNMLGAISGTKRDSPKASGKKKSRTSGGPGKSKKNASAKESKAASKAKQSKKQRLVTYEEKQEISNATEHMNEAQVAKLTTIITENVSKYKDMAGDDVELEIDDLPNEVQHKLLKYVRTIFPRHRDEPIEELGLDDDYEPDARGGKGGGPKKKHKPMKKAEQERRIAELKSSMEQMRDNQSAGAGAQAESSDDEDSESSEEE
ncbi:hypothetical protein ANO11243_025680 [Dothideomycetidae sp. 11243]|nr:hypothetical protein ANO11243_025680 [fungal sp. No.11243]